MKDFEIVHFYPPEEIFDSAATIFEKEKAFLETLFSDTDIQHVGSAAVPGAWGKFDVDIQIRVTQEQFPLVRDALLQVLPQKHPHIWDDQFALFSHRPESPIEVDYIVNVIGDYRDDYSKIRDSLITNPELLKEYNDLKKSFEGKLFHEYRTAKKAFMRSHGGQW